MPAELVLPDASCSTEGCDHVGRVGPLHISPLIADGQLRGLQLIWNDERDEANDVSIEIGNRNDIEALAAYCALMLGQSWVDTLDVLKPALFGAAVQIASEPMKRF